MSIVVNEQTKVLVQGITGNEGRFRTEAMLRYGTPVVAGVTPGKGGEEVHGVAVFNTVAEAVRERQVNTSLITVPAAFTRNAFLEAVEAGIKTVVIITEHIPIRDSIECITAAHNKGCLVVGPNCPGVINPGLCIHIGVMPVHIFQPGGVGIVSRSGTLTYEIAWNISRAGIGQSTCLGIGGDPVVGLDYIKVLEMFRADEETKAVVLIGEIGGNAEELAAQYIIGTNYPKQVVAYIAGRSAPPEKRMGHAGAIISGHSGSADSKIAAFNRAGVMVAEKPGEIVRLLSNKSSS